MIYLINSIQIIIMTVIMIIVLKLKKENDLIHKNINDIVEDSIEYDNEDNKLNNINYDDLNLLNKGSHITDAEKDYFMDGFTTSKNYFWSSLQLIYFDMFMNCEILDYETQVKEIATRLNKLLDSPQYRDELIKKLDEYVENH